MINESTTSTENMLLLAQFGVKLPNEHSTKWKEKAFLFSIKDIK